MLAGQSALVWSVVALLLAEKSCSFSGANHYKSMHPAFESNWLIEED
jgi:hypothetical protein